MLLNTVFIKLGVVDKTKCKLYKGNGSYILSIKKSFIEDSGCCFKEGDSIVICMVGPDKMIIYKETKDDDPQS